MPFISEWLNIDKILVEIYSSVKIFVVIIVDFLYFQLSQIFGDFFFILKMSQEMCNLVGNIMHT